MKINKDLIYKIFELKIKIIKKSDKVKISKFDEIIPMYDIFSKRIFPILKYNLHDRLINSHYRFINNELKDWISNQIKKKNKYYDILKNNLNIISNYDINILEETSYKTLYKYSKDFGFKISICKRNSFHPHLYHNNPYYDRLELIKLGQNIGIIKNFDIKNIIDKELHYKLCKNINNNDVNYEEIRKSNLNIIKEGLLNYVSFYSFTGSQILNNFLRNSETISRENFNSLKKLVEGIKKSNPLDKNYYLYRFIWDDSFVKNMKLGSYLNDPGFLSTTRDPFYSPGIESDFGYTLFKIKIPKNKIGLGLFIENYSLFPKEEEFIIPPYSKLKLISKDSHFKYYHTNEIYEKYIKKKYEFELVDIQYNKFDKISINDEFIPNINLEEIEIDEINKILIIKRFLNYFNELKQINININNKIYTIVYQWFDSSDSYSKLFYNKTKEGILFSCFQNGYPIFNIECGNELIINYLNKFYFYDKRNNIDDEDIIYISVLFAKIFKYNKIKKFFSYSNFSELESYSGMSEDYDLLYCNLYCSELYNYIKNKIKIKNSSIDFEYSYWKLDQILKLKIPTEVNNKLNTELQNLSWGELIEIIIEKYFYLYKRLENWLNKYCDNLINKCYYNINTKSYLKKYGIIINNFDFYYNENEYENIKKTFISNVKRII
jgi:hypothetical protein